MLTTQNLVYRVIPSEDISLAGRVTPCAPPSQDLSPNRPHAIPRPANRPRFLSAFIQKPELVGFALVSLLLNAPLLAGSCWHSLVFDPTAVRSGQWWRLVTHPFVHLTWYHLLLDGSAFFLLYHSLLDTRWVRRVGYVLAGAAGSLVATWATGHTAKGLCGLSGIAHGLMAISAVEMLSRYPRNSPEWRVGLGTLAFIAAKAGYEALTGRMFFAFLDFGLLGSPVSVSHAGGIIGTLVLLLLCQRRHLQA
jgi:rhomboid family GlyGly-CTERM serine protease